jgi:hypothetical protein
VLGVLQVVVQVTMVLQVEKVMGIRQPMKSKALILYLKGGKGDSGTKSNGVAGSAGLTGCNGSAGKAGTAGTHGGYGGAGA